MLESLSKVNATNCSQAFHPFYVFQIASLILWSLDEYYYYAACIFVISVVSITTTLIETRAVSSLSTLQSNLLTTKDHETITRSLTV